MRMAMISMNDLFYGEREAVQILKDENVEILDIIHRYNYFYTEPPPLVSNVEVNTEDSEDEDVESNWRENELALQDAADGKKDGNEPGKSPSQPEEDAKVALRVPMCCPECEETVTIALQNVAGNQPVQGYQSRDNHRCLVYTVGIMTVLGIIVVLAITSVHSARR